MTLRMAYVVIAAAAVLGLEERTARAADPTIAALCRKVIAVADETLRKDEAHAAIVAGGTRHAVHVAHASGTTDNPMSDAAIEGKFFANTTPAIGDERARRACALVWSLDKLADVRELIALLA